MNETRLHPGSIPQHATSGWLARLFAHLPVLLRIRPSGSRVLKHLETLSVGPRKCIHLIECNGQRFLVADGVAAPVPLLPDGVQR